MEEVVRKLTVEVKSLRKENDTLKTKNEPLGEDTTLSQTDWIEIEAHIALEQAISPRK